MGWVGGWGGWQAGKVHVTTPHGIEKDYDYESAATLTSDDLKQYASVLCNGQLVDSTFVSVSGKWPFTFPLLGGSGELFVTPNYGISTTPAHEWAFVADATAVPGEAAVMAWRGWDPRVARCVSDAVCDALCVTRRV